MTTRAEHRSAILAEDDGVRRLRAEYVTMTCATLDGHDTCAASEWCLCECHPSDAEVESPPGECECPFCIAAREAEERDAADGYDPAEPWMDR